ncbi:MAG: flagellar filament capping protein FliD [Bacteroidetes bacterium]|nr:flagellar filament capping protein FliD [Bacteroidota bacterium]
MASVSDISSVDQLVAQYRQSKRKPALTLETKKSALNIRLAVLADLKTKLKTLKTTAEDLQKTGTTSKFSTFSVASTNTSIATATATTTADVGSHALKIERLAKNDTLLSDRITSAATTLSAAEGAGTKTFRVSLNGVDTDVSVGVTEGETNEAILSKLVAAINDSDAEVTASSVGDTSTTKKLVLISKTSGASNAVSVTDLSGTLMEKIGFSSGVISGRTANGSTTAGYANSSVSLLNSSFTVDGITVEKESNTVSDVLTGVTLELKGTQAETDLPITLTVGVNKASIKEKVQKFITDYNAALSYINTKTQYDSLTRTREALSGDSIFTSFRYNLRSLATEKITSVKSGNPSILADIGITAGRDGTLSLSDTTKFDDALDADLTKVSDLFNSSSGLASKLVTLIDGMTNSSTGKIVAVKDAADSQVLNLTNRITRFDETLDRHVEKYRNDFLRLQATYNQILAQQQTISSLTSSFY